MKGIGIGIEYILVKGQPTTNMEIQDIIIQDIIVMIIIMVRTDRTIIPDIVKGIMNLHHKGTMLQLKNHLLLKISRTGMITRREVTKISILVLGGK